MYIINSPSFDAYFNIAAEEYLLKNMSEDIFFLYRNNSSVIIGKHQNTMAEINFELVKRLGIPVVRRLSGGGTVYHDLGNINFTYIFNGEIGKLSDFKKFTNPIIDFLHKYGLRAVFEGKNNLTINGLKFSGNAEHIYRNRVIHHGTILYSSDLNTLIEAIDSSNDKYRDSKIKSIRSSVTNLSDKIVPALPITDFIESLGDFIGKYFGGYSYYTLNDSDRRQILSLVVQKYAKWDWNYAYQADYNFSGAINTKLGLLKIVLEVSAGKIVKSSIIVGNNDNHLVNFENQLIGAIHREDEIRSQLVILDFESTGLGITLDEFIEALF